MHKMIYTRLREGFLTVDTHNYDKLDQKNEDFAA